MHIKKVEFILGLLLFQIISPIFTTSISLSTNIQTEHKHAKRNAKIAFDVVAKSVKSPNLFTPTILYVSRQVMKLFNIFKVTFNEKNLNETTNNSVATSNKKIPEKQKLVSNKIKPTFAEKNSNLSESIDHQYVKRLIKKRAVPAFIPTVGNMIGWAAVMTAAGAATSYIDHKIRESSENEKEERLARKIIDYERNNFGCIADLCWTNCGPRLGTGDWCFITKNITVKPIKFLECKVDTDCNPCLPCGMSCVMEGGFSTPKN